jgi:hypothetical protein
MDRAPSPTTASEIPSSNQQMMSSAEELRHQMIIGEEENHLLKEELMRLRVSTAHHRTSFQGAMSPAHHPVDHSPQRIQDIDDWTNRCDR